MPYVCATSNSDERAGSVNVIILADQRPFLQEPS